MEIKDLTDHMNKQFSDQIEHLLTLPVLPVWVPGHDIDLWPGELVYSVVRENVGKDTYRVLCFVIRGSQLFIIKSQMMNKHQADALDFKIKTRGMNWLQKIKYALSDGK